MVGTQESEGASMGVKTGACTQVMHVLPGCD